MTKRVNNWRNKSLELLENKSWGDSSNAPTNLVKRCIELSKIPIGNFTLEDLRVMIGQKLGLQYLIPLAIEKLQENIFIDTELYEGDLLEKVLKIDTSYWDNNENYWTQLNELIKDKIQDLKELRIDTTKFDNSQFARKKGYH